MKRGERDIMSNGKQNSMRAEEIDFVQLLRSKTEENDLKQLLKSTMGGYTKQSVSNYLGIIHKNQQSMAETFYENQQLLYLEKEKLRQDNEKLLSKFNELDTKYLDLSSHVYAPIEEPNQASEEEIIRLNDIISSLNRTIIALQETVTKLTEQNDQLREEMQGMTVEPTNHSMGGEVRLKSQIESLEIELEEGVSFLEKLSAENADLKMKLELAQQEADTRKTLLLSNDTESEQARARTTELSEMLESQFQTLKNERIQWETDKAIYETEKLKLEEQLALSKQYSASTDNAQNTPADYDLMMKVNELTEQLALQTDLVASENKERTIREETIRSLSAQIEALKADSASFRTTIENLSLQTEKLLLANTTMCTRMEEECRRTTVLINEKSDVSIEKLTAMRKLSEAETKIAMLEMELSRSKYEQR
jgi:chromosome segregation ATPase